MWDPTHMIVTVLRARNLIIKGKNGSNNCFVTIALGKEKFQTTIIEKAEENVEWREECELTIPNKGNRAELIFNVYHRNKLGLDDFLGQAVLPLNDMDVYEQPRSRWCQLQSKQGKDNKKDRGELEIRVSFTVKAGSLKDLSKAGKSRTSIPNLVGGSLLSLGTLDKRKSLKSLKSLTKSLGNKLKKNKLKGSTDDISSTASTPSLNEFRKYKNDSHHQFDTLHGHADPGVISENEDELILDNLSQKSSNISLNKSHFSEFNVTNQNLPTSAGSAGIGESPAAKDQDEWQTKLFGRKTLERKPFNGSFEVIKAVDSSQKMIDDAARMEEIPIQKSPQAATTPEVNVKKIIPEPAPRSPFIGDGNNKEKSTKEASFFNKLTNKANLKNKRNEKIERDTPIIQQQNQQNNVSNIKVPEALLQKHEGKSREELILMLQSSEVEISNYKQKVKEMEDYLDVLLLRVMEREPRILQNPYSVKACPTKSG